jgi:hypothetical protein
VCFAQSFEPDPLELVPGSSSAGNGPNTAKTKILICILSCCVTQLRLGRAKGWGARPVANGSGCRGSPLPSRLQVVVLHGTGTLCGKMHLVAVKPLAQTYHVSFCLLLFWTGFWPKLAPRPL